MSTVSGGFSLVALLDGTTINGFLRVDNMPLVQRYTKGSKKYTPDFEATAENARPVVVTVVRDINDGSLLIPDPNSISYSYNGKDLTFGPDGLCNTAGFEGMFKKVVDYSATIGSATHQMTALRVMKNLVPVSGYDNDRIAVKGQVEISGQRIPFAELSTDVIIQETTGNQYDIVLTNNKGSALTVTGETLTEKVEIYRDGVKLSDLQGFTFKWVKETATGDVNMGTTQTQAITTSDVDNVLKIRCDVYQAGTIVASGYDEITDFSDPLRVEFQITGITGTVVRKGQTATVTPQAVKRSSGENVPGVKSWNFNVKDNNGAEFTLTGKSSSRFTGANCQITYADMKRAKMGLSGYVSANF